MLTIKIVIETVTYSAKEANNNYNHRSFSELEMGMIWLTPSKLFVTMLDVKVDLVGNSWALCCLHGLSTEESCERDNDEAQ